MKHLYLCALFLFSVDFAAAQRLPETPRDPRNPLPDFVYRNEEKRRELERDRQRAENALPGNRIDLRRGREERERRDVEREERRRIEELIKPHPDDAARYEDFLKQKNTGMTRLIPDLGCENKMIVYADGDCARSVPSGWIYSFRLEDYTISKDWSDLRLDGTKLFADGFLVQGILTALGDVEIENLTAESDGMAFINQFTPGKTFTEAKRQANALANGVESFGKIYSNRVEIKTGAAYALRSIAYKSDKKVSSKMVKGELKFDGDPRFSNLDLDNRRDITIVFRVIRVETNGGITIVWKELAREPAPKLEFAKGEKAADIR